MAIRVSIVEDDAGVRESLSSLIAGARGFACLGAYSSGEDALREIPAARPDVVLMDIHLPLMSGIECVRQLKAVLPSLPIVMLTVYDDQEKLFKSLMAGACGYLLKRTSPAKLLEAIREVHQGGAPMSGQIARMVVQHFHATREQTAAPAPAFLTVREQEILDHLARGYRYKEIAEALQISFDTVRSHLRAIYEKLHVHSRTEAVVKYLNK
jgi:DNA-binding NarL/FixJ family response regulator